MRITEGLRVGTATALALVLTACGGGSGNGDLSGGGSSGGGKSQGFNLQTGIANMVSHGLAASVTLSGTVVVNGTSTAVTGSGNYTLSAGAGGATFNGTTGTTTQTQALVGTVTASGQTLQINQSVTDYYATSNNDFLGETSSSEYDVAQAPFQYPTTVSGGESGTLGTLLRYSDSTMSKSLGSAQTTYTTTSTQNGPLGVTITTKIYNTTNTLQETDVTNYTLSTSNVITFVSSTAQQTGGTITATAQ
jgi:hypothetical protein